MNKKGFTLIELLAVIIVLAVILVIAVPKILNVIDDSRKSAYKSTNQMIVSAVKRSNQIGSLDPTFEMARTYSFEDGLVSPELELSGELPTSGSVEVNSEGEIRLRLLNDRYYALKRYEESEVTIFDADDRLSPDPEGMYPVGDPVTIPIPTKNGYTFDGWTGGTVTDNEIVMGNTDITLTATWSLTPYTIGYTLDSGIVDGTNPTEYNMASPTITLINPTRTDYIFTGWTGSNGETPQTTVEIEEGSTGDKTYTANWKSKYVYYYNLGNENTTLTGGWTVSGGWAATYKKNTDNMYINSGKTNSSATAKTTSSINLSDIKTIHIEHLCNGYSGGDQTGVSQFKLGGTRIHSFVSVSAKTTTSIDVASYDSSYQLLFYVSTGDYNSYSKRCYIYKVYGELE